MSLTPRIDRLENNKIINGNFDIWQRNTSVTINTVSGSGYVADRVAYQFGPGGGTTKNFSISRSTDAPSFADTNFSSAYSYKSEMLTGHAMAAAGDYVVPFQYRMEGLDFATIHKKTITLSFNIKASITGEYSVALENAPGDRGYLTTITVNSANTWEKKSLTIELDQVGTWNLDNTIGIQIAIGACTGTTYQSSTLDVWNSAHVFMASTAVNWCATTNATMQISQFMINEGEATGSFSRAGRNIAEELVMCQRYYEKSMNLNDFTLTGSSPGRAIGISRPDGNVFDYIYFQVRKRVFASMIAQGGATVSFTGHNENGIGIGGLIGGSSSWAIDWTADAEL